MTCSNLNIYAWLSDDSPILCLVMIAIMTVTTNEKGNGEHNTNEHREFNILILASYEPVPSVRSWPRFHRSAFQGGSGQSSGCPRPSYSPATSWPDPEHHGKGLNHAITSKTSKTSKVN